MERKMKIKIMDLETMKEEFPEFFKGTRVHCPDDYIEGNVSSINQTNNPHAENILGLTLGLTNVKRFHCHIFSRRGIRHAIAFKSYDDGPFYIVPLHQKGCYYLFDVTGWVLEGGKKVYEQRCWVIFSSSYKEAEKEIQKKYTEIIKLYCDGRCKWLEKGERFYYLKYGCD